MMENGTLPLIWCGLVALTWALTIYQSHRLGRKFVAKYPAIAAKEIPFAFSHFGHPEKAMFFWRRRAVELLRMDRELWKERRWFVGLSVASVAVFLIGFAMMLTYAVLHQ